MFVDDDENICKFLKSALIKCGGFYVDVAGSVSEAVWKFTENHYDVLITDINMPDVSGYFLIKHVKKYFSHCRIIAVSADPSSLGEAKALGASVLLPKPFSVTEIIEQLSFIKSVKSGSGGGGDYVVG